MYRFFAYLVPERARRHIQRLLAYADVRTRADTFIGFILIFGLAAGLVVAWNLWVLFRLNPVLYFIIVFISIEVVVYTLLALSIGKKARYIEMVLPDALQLMASNLRAGLTTDRALLLSARPEFGPLADELNKAGKEIATGREISEALKEITARVRSDILDRTISLIVSGLRSGGELASLLEQNAADLRNQDLVDKKIRSSVQMYVIFIFAALGIGAPVLFALSSILVDVISANLNAVFIPPEVSARIPISVSGIQVSSSFIVQYTLLSLVTSVVLGSLVLGLISKGKEREGIRYILILLVLSLSAYFAVRTVLQALFSGLFGI
ncbi:type II secretion system F family protein [Candidatus Woesearchaeota archaeon]|nr:type II secretion system F family protein [Candidatus Woesearchaeota archaeon]